MTEALRTSMSFDFGERTKCVDNRRGELQHPQANMVITDSIENLLKSNKIRIKAAKNFAQTNKKFQKTAKNT